MVVKASLVVPKNSSAKRAVLFAVSLMAMAATATMMSFYTTKSITPTTVAAMIRGPQNSTQIQFVTEHGRNTSLESIHTTLTVQMPRMNRTGNVLDVLVQSRRRNCDIGTCLYRAYLDGPARMGKYLRNHDNTSSYGAQFDIFEPGTYRLLVLLEALTNNSNTLGLAPHDGAVYVSETELCMGERISRTNATVGVYLDDNTYLPPYQHDGNQYSTALPRCKYGIEDVSLNKFEWVRRSALESHGFSPESTGIIPSAYLASQDFLHNYTEENADTFMNSWTTDHPEWIQPYQEYVWHPRTCVQPWVERQDIEQLATKLGGLEIFLLGTSRVRDTVNIMEPYLKRNAPANSMIQRVAQGKAQKSSEDRLNLFCSQDVDNNKELPAVVLVISLGIWEATFHNTQKRLRKEKSKPTIFRFLDMAESSIRQLQEKCAGRRFKIIVMTQPVTHVFDARNGDPYVSSRHMLREESAKYYISGQSTALRNARIDVCNWAWKAMAAKYNLQIVDAEAMSFARFDTVWDNTHYVLPFSNKTIGNEVTMTYAHYVMAAVLQAFDDESTNPVVNSSVQRGV